MKHAGKTKAQLIGELEEVSQGLAEDALREALQQKNTELNSFLNNIPDMAWLKDIESRFIAVNQAFGEAVEKDPESLLNQTCEVCFGEEEAKKFQEDDWKVIESGKQRVIEEQIVDSRGKEIWLETIKSPILDKSGKVQGTVGIAREITKRKQVEEALRKAHDEMEHKVKERTGELLEINEQLRQEIEYRKGVEERLRESEAYIKGILNAAPAGIGLVRMRELDWVSHRMCEMLGYSADELIGQSARIAYESDEEFERVGRVKYSEIQERGVGSVETSFKRKDGSVLDVLLSSSVVDPGDLSEGTIFTALDITESKQAEQELRESEQRYSSLFKNNHSVMLLVDPVSAEIVDANPAARSFYGWTQEELTGMKITDINMLSNEQIFQEMERAKSEERNHFFFHHRLANEEIRNVEVYSGPIRVHGKQLLYSIIHDISERKQAEDALRESEHYFRSLLFNMHEDILVIDRDYRITDVNNTLLVTVGLKYEEVVGRHCYEVSHGYNEPCDRKGEECVLHEVFETGDARNCRHQHVRADGSKVWVDILLSPLRDENGDVTHVIEAIRDVTDLIEMEKELRKSEENFRALAENANDGILIASGEEGVNVYANKRAVQITGYSVAELLEIGLRELVAPDAVDKVADRYKRRLMGKNVPSQYETTLVRKSGETFPAELSSARSFWKGQLASIVIIRNITKRKKRETALRKSKAELLEKSRHLEEVNAALKVLFKRREEDKEELGENVFSNVRQLVFPYLEKLRKSQLNTRQTTLVEILETNIKEIVSPFVTKLSSKLLNLTPTEIRVASLIRDGRTTKEIAELLRLSENTIVFHRYNIRSKLSLKNKKVNLRSYLKSLHQ